jgi:VanZ family protein
MLWFKYFFPAISWSVVILVITLMPAEKLPEVGIIQIDKLVHFFVFGLLMFLTMFGAVKVLQHKNSNANIVIPSFIYGTGLGVLVEFLQLFVPGRTFSVIDIIANTIGTIIGYYVFKFVRRKKAL